MATECCNDNKEIEDCEQMQLNKEIFKSLEMLTNALENQYEIIKLITKEVRPDLSEIIDDLEQVS